MNPGMKAHRLAALGFGCLLAALTVPARAQVGSWAIAGEAHVVARYEGRTIRTAYPFTLNAMVREDGSYTLSGLDVASCQPPDVPPAETSGRWTGSRRRLLAVAMGDGLRDGFEACGAEAVRVIASSGRTRRTREGGLSGRFGAQVRARFVSGREVETIRARVRGRFAGTRADG